METLLGIGGFIFLIALTITQIRSGGAAGLKESNQILRDQVTDQKAEIEKLKNNHKEELDGLRNENAKTAKETAELKGRLLQLNEQKTGYEKLIMASLQNYWMANPTAANDIATAITKDPNTVVH